MTKSEGFQLNVDDIVGVATEIFLEKGLDAVSMRSVSARLGVSPVPLYSRIGNKEDLLDAMADHLLANLAPSISPGERWPDYATRWSVEIRRRLLATADSRLILRERRDQYVEATRPLITLMRANGLSSDMAVQGCRQLIWAIVGFVALEGYQTRPPGDRSRRLRAGADPAGVTPEEIEELFMLQIRYLIEGIARGSTTDAGRSRAVMITDDARVHWHSDHSAAGPTVLPLAGVRVLDQTDEWGELSTRLLGDLGADVIRVEPVGGSRSRRAAPVRKGISLGWVFRNGGKRVLELDTTAHGRSELDRLLADADVLATSAPVDGDLLDRFPNLVVVVITPYGLTGPYATWQATDAVIAATAAQAFKAGASDREPLPPPGRFCDHVASATAAFAMLCALRHRNVHGVRSVLDFSVNEAVAQMSDWSLPNGIARQQVGQAEEARKGSGPVYPVFRCRDGHVRLVVLSPRQWHAMRAWLGEPDYLQDPELDGFIERLQLSDAVLNPLYRTFFADRDMDAVCAEAQRRGIVCTPVYSAAETLACAHLRARNSFVTAEIAPEVTPALLTGFFEIGGRRAGPRWTNPPVQSDENQPKASEGPIDCQIRGRRCADASRAGGTASTRLRPRSRRSGDRPDVRRVGRRRDQN